MNKKLLSIIALGVTVTGALASGIFAGEGLFTRSSKAPAAAIDNTAGARKALRAADVNPAMLTPMADETAEPVVLLDNAPAFQQKITDFVVLDANDDKDTWEIGNNTWDNFSYLMITVYSSSTLNDWVFIPFDAPDAGNLDLSFRASTSYSDGHSFEVFVGKDSTPEAMTSKLASRDNYGTGSLNWSYVKESIEGSATVNEAGKYWLGIHATSPGGAYKLYIRDITLAFTAGSTPAPAEPGDIFTMHPTEAEFAACTVIDGNGDGNKIFYDVHQGADGSTFDWPIAYNKSDSPAAKSDADEWIITPAVNLPNPNRLYTASIEATSTTTLKSESFEIVMASAADLASMRSGKVIMSEPAVSNQDYEAFTSKFGITDPGQYYFGIHITSKLDDGWRLMLRDFKVTLTELSSEIPGTVSNLSLTADATGALQTAVEFDLPTTYINGIAIPAGATVQAEIATPADAITVSGTPGQHISTTIAAAEGQNIVSVTALNDNGRGAEVKGVVVCGIGIPDFPDVTYTVSDDNLSLNLTWEPVTVSNTGGVVNPEEVTYNVYQYIQTSEASGWLPIQTGLTDCNFTYTVTDQTQQLYQLIVSAKNSKGESEGDLRSYAMAMLGTPHTMPLNETFPGKQQTYAGLLIDYPETNYTADWALDNPANLGITGGTESALMCVTLNQEYVGYGYVELPKVSTKGCEKPRLRLLTYLGDFTPETVIRIHSTEGRGNGEVLGTISSASGSGWTELTYDIPRSYFDKGWIVVSFDVHCTSVGNAFILASYSLAESVANDLALTQLSMPSYAYLGDNITFKATLQNRGYDPATTPDLKAIVYFEGSEVATVNLTHTAATLSENQTAEYTGSLRLGNADMSGREYEVEVVLPDEDGDASNNFVTGAFRVGFGDQPVATDLKAEGNQGETLVHLSWTDPMANGYVDRMEGYAHGDYSYNLGDWKNIDFDKAQNYYSQDFDIPDPGLPKAFQIVNSMLSGIDAKGGMGQPSGDQFLMCYSPQEAQADDWLISPEVAGGSLMSFYITSLSSAYTESVEVLVSSTDDELDSFSTFTSFDLTSGGWNLFESQLPADTKYFAIHYISNDQFGICIDDIAYTPVEAPYDIEGWNIYRDGKLVAENSPSTLYLDEIPDATATYDYNVAATGTRRGVKMEFPLSATVSYGKSSSITDVTADADALNITVEKGLVTVSDCQGKKVEIADLRGITLYSARQTSDTLTLPLPAGLYIITVDARSAKILVP